MCSAPVLAYPEYNREFILDTDASDVAVGAVLSHKFGDGERVIAYFSTTHSPPEKHYSVTRKELLAVVKHFKHYLIGKEFTVRTDHSSLQWLLKFKEPQGQVARWIEFLSSYQMKIEHRKGEKHKNADAMSRYPQRCQAIQFSGWSNEYIVEVQGRDVVLSKVIQLLKAFPNKPDEALHENAGNRSAVSKLKPTETGPLKKP